MGAKIGVQKTGRVTGIAARRPNSGQGNASCPKKGMPVQQPAQQFFGIIRGVSGQGRSQQKRRCRIIRHNAVRAAEPCFGKRHVAIGQRGQAALYRRCGNRAGILHAIYFRPSLDRMEFNAVTFATLAGLTKVLPTGAGAAEPGRCLDFAAAAAAAVAADG
jgi:hypothetical protein